MPEAFILDPRSVLLITLDSCRYDTFVDSAAPNMRAVGPVHCAQAPSYFTFGSHAAMFVGFTPGVPGSASEILNPKLGKLFGIRGCGRPGRFPEPFLLEGRNIVEGFRRLGYITLGTGAVGWFNNARPAGQVLTSDFEHFLYAGNTWSLRKQVAWVSERLEAAGDRPVFVFLNVGETHVPYYFEGAPWSRKDNPCTPFQEEDRSFDCRQRQRLCVEYIDGELGGLLDAFRGATTMVCSDHGDCWGEDGLWEHGVSHAATLTVPLIVRCNGVPVAEAAGRAMGA